MTDFPNPILDTDSYKASHYLQYPPGTEYVSSYIEARGGAFTESLFFGLQSYLTRLEENPIYKSDIDDAESFFQAHGVPFNRAGWDHILNKHHGHLPIRIQAVPEGLVMPISNVMVQAVNTDPMVPWLTSYMETALLRAVWYPTTVATQSFQIKRLIKRYLDLTCDNPEAELPFKLHDFGARGVSSRESAAIGGAAHLVNFMGSDTITGIEHARLYYGEDMAGFSIPAAEHSTITSWGRYDEVAAYDNMLAQFAQPGKLLAVVSDSYDIYNAVEYLWGEVLRQKVIDSGATLVVRPDSGDPVEVVYNVVTKLMDKFGYSVNGKGYKVLPKCVRVIQGDGVNARSIADILGKLMMHGISAENVAFGMGGALLQGVNRDTMHFAMKCSAICIDGKWHDVKKDPITDSGKRSKAGRLALADTGGTPVTVREDELGDNNNLLVDVFMDGEYKRIHTFADIRQRAGQYL